MKFGLSEATIHQINHVLEQYSSIESVLIYGSRAKGNYKVGSDIDLTLIGNSISHQDLVEIGWKLDELLIPYTVDLSIFSHIDNPDLKDHILRVGKIFYQKSGHTPIKNPTKN